MRSILSSSYILFLLIILTYRVDAQTQSGYLTNDGTWCWFSDPRAILVNNKIITGWVKSDGTIESVVFDLASSDIQAIELYYKLEADDHDNPAFTLTDEGKALAMYTRHSRKDLFINVLSDLNDNPSFSKPRLIHPWNENELQKFPRQTMTYANPYRLSSEEDRIYCFGRWTGFKPNVMWSDDSGLTWSDARVFITNYPFDSNNRPYVKYFSDGQSRVHIVFTDGHPRDEPTNSVYYAYYENGAFYKASGELICTIDEIPFEPSQASVVYTSNPTEGRAWIADIGQDENGDPVILYTRSPTEENHEYWYARYSGQDWIEQKICDSGKWFPQTPEGQKEWEPHYFGGMSIHPNDAGVVYLSREIKGTFEIERWETHDEGSTWKSEAITQNSEFDNVRPYVPRGLSSNDNEIVLWMENQKYIHYTNYKTSIQYLIRKK